MNPQSLCDADYGQACSCSQNKSKTNVKILVGVTASVATIKLGELVDALLSSASITEVGVVATDKSEKFYNVEEITSIGSKYEKPEVRIWRDEDEWSMWNGRGDPVLHIELGKWADAMILAPLDANTLAKISHGLCDNLLTCTLRAWDLKNVKTKPVFFCPAMNTKMWEHPLTSEQIQQLEGFGYTQIPPIEKTLMCGDTGIGAMAPVKTIVSTVESQLAQSCTCGGSSCSKNAERSGPSSSADMYNACANSWYNSECASSSENADIK